MKRKRVNYLGCLSASALMFLLLGCQSGLRIRPAESKEIDSDEAELSDADRAALTEQLKALQDQLHDRGHRAHHENGS